MTSLLRLVISLPLSSWPDEKCLNCETSFEYFNLLTDRNNGRNIRLGNLLLMKQRAFFSFIFLFLTLLNYAHQYFSRLSTVTNWRFSTLSVTSNFVTMSSSLRWVENLYCLKTAAIMIFIDSQAYLIPMQFLEPAEKKQIKSEHVEGWK